jgi:hypothetical protein
MNSNIILTAACERILVFCGPSQLTNLWQPNDSGTNKTFKENLKQIIALFLEIKKSITHATLAINIYDALVLPNMNNAIMNSFRHYGIYPFDKAKIIKMITNEQPDQMLFQNIHVEATFNLVSQHMNTLESFKIEKRK